MACLHRRQPTPPQGKREKQHEAPRWQKALDMSSNHHDTQSLNTEVSDGSQPPLTLDLSLSESAGSRSLHRFVGRSS